MQQAVNEVFVHMLGIRSHSVDVSFDCTERPIDPCEFTGQADLS